MDTAKVSAEYLEWCRIRGLSQSTIAQYSWALKRLEQQCPRVPKKSTNVIRVVSDLSLSLESRKDLVKWLRTFFKWLGRQR